MNYWSSVLEQRLSRRRALIGTGAGAAGAAFLAACGSDSGGEKSDSSSLVTKIEDTSKQAKRGGVNKWWRTEEPQHLDVYITHNPLVQFKGHIIRNLFQAKPGYLGPQQFDGVEGDMIESWEFSPDQLTLTMKLRQGIKFHNKPPVNGRVMDVEDITKGWDRHGRISTLRATYHNEVNPEAPVISITAPDTKTLVMKLKEPTIYILEQFSHPSSGHFQVIPKETDDTFNIKTDMIGTGAFMLKKWEPSVGMTFVRNPDYFVKDHPYLDEVDVPWIPEYATGLSQLRAGNIYQYDVRAEDVLATKRDVPALRMYQKLVGGFTSHTTSFGWLPGGQSPFKDERVRQAVSMAIDRQLYVDSLGNVDSYKKEGLPVETAWLSHFGDSTAWWLNPQSKDFGANGKYFQYDLAEAKKLMAAAGYASGFSIESQFGTLTGNTDRETNPIDGMVADIGIKTNRHLMDTGIDYPKYRDTNGKFEGWAYILGAPQATEAVAFAKWRFWSKGGTAFLGFDANGKGDQSGDPAVDDMVVKASREFDTEKRRALLFELQRYLGKAMYNIPKPGQFSSFDLAWPALKNYFVLQGDNRRENYNWWIDENEAPLKKA